MAHVSPPAELLAAFDVADPGFIADPYPVLGAVREATPLYRDDAQDVWVVTRFDDIKRLLRDRRVGRVFHHRYTPEELGHPPPDPRWSAFDANERWSLLELEPPDHTRIRSLVAKVFTPRAVEAVRPEMERLADGLLAEAVAREAFDLIGDVAQPYSVAVICSLLGVPRADTQLLLDWSHAIVKMYEPAVTDEQRAAADRASAEFREYTADLIAAKRRQPDDALVSRLVAVEEEGEHLTEDEIISTTIVLLDAGHEATVNTMGNGTRALLRHPDQWRRLVDGEVDARTAVEEMLRWDAPLQRFDRWVLDDGLEVADTPIPVGEKIAMLFCSGERDPRRFDDPDRFDVGRGDPAHLAFGGGIHFCVGAPLARLEIEVALAALIRRAPGLVLAAEPRYHPTFTIRGLEALHVAPRA
ncbi:MAG TPA: cytochrome P450 [Acidimicrobiales bacterium]|nr:cytochrome P450 [Acidimicrobiales bacterium]